MTKCQAAATPTRPMSGDTQSDAEVTAPPANNNPGPQTSQGDELERAKALVKLKVIDWVRQQTRDDPVSLALKMPYLQSRLKAWEYAKASGDAGAMTKSYNDLLRGVEAEQNRRGIPKDQQRVLSNDHAENIAREILNAEPAKMLEKLRAAKAQHGEYAEGLMKQIAHFMPQALRTADSHSSKLMGEMIWRRTGATAQPTQLLPDLPETGFVEELRPPTYSALGGAGRSSPNSDTLAHDEMRLPSESPFKRGGEPTQCAAFRGQLSAAEKERNRADVMRMNWEKAHEAPLKKLTEAIERMNQIDREMDEIEKKYGVEQVDPPGAAHDRPKPGESRFRFLVRKFGWAVAIEMTKNRLQDARAFWDKSAFYEEIERIVELQKEYDRQLADYESKRRVEQSKYEAAEALVERIRGDMNRLGCKVS
jgi:hypothetical protein